jgi:hypothetical protein
MIYQTRESALKAIGELIEVEVETTKKSNYGDGRISKKLEARERKVINNLLSSILGFKAVVTEDEFNKLIP